MKLFELFSNLGTFSPITGGSPEDHINNNPRYEPDDDESIVRKSDTRKTRLTLRQLNRLRRMRDVKRLEKSKDLEIIRKMYAQPKQDAGAGGMGMF